MYVSAMSRWVDYDSPGIPASSLNAFFCGQLSSLASSIRDKRLRHKGRVVLLVGVVGAPHQRAGCDVLESHFQTGDP